MRTIILSLLATAIVVTGVAYAAEFKCVGERIEKGSSTWGYAKTQGSDFRIEKGSSTIGYVKNRGGKWAIEDTGSNTLAWLNGTRIEKSNGSTWASLSDAKSFCDGPDPVAAAMWVYKQAGKL